MGEPSGGASAGPVLPTGFTLHAHDEIDSTNEEARRLAAAGAPHGTVVWARRQTAGRGRRGRSWVSEPGNLFVSFLLRPSRPAAEAAQISFLSALAVGEALDRFRPVDTALAYKWPNDVLLDGSKVSGILLESAAGGPSGLAWLVVGIGINLAHHPDDVERPAAHVGAGAKPEAVLAVLAERLAHWLARWEREGFGPARDVWLARAAGLGGPVTVRLANETLDGLFEGLGPDGTLALLLPDGSRRAIAAGDVFLPA
jgi:BirA family biotin operon repressor/biotin-[acetyl-CoA-carboxylase] ligase